MSPKVVLTAARCIIWDPNFTLKIVAGTENLRIKNYNRQDRKVTSIDMHHGFNPTTKWVQNTYLWLNNECFQFRGVDPYNMAVLHLSEKLVFNSRIWSIPFSWNVYRDNTLLSNDLYATVSGWRSSRESFKDRVAIIKNRKSKSEIQICYRICPERNLLLKML